MSAEIIDFADARGRRAVQRDAQRRLQAVLESEAYKAARDAWQREEAGYWHRLYDDDDLPGGHAA